MHKLEVPAEGKSLCIYEFYRILQKTTEEYEKQKNNQHPFKL